MAKGFFSPEELEKEIQIDFNFDDGPNCDKCGLFTKCTSPKAKYTGEGRKKVLIVGEAFGKSEDKEWKQLGYSEPTQFIGQAGQLLREHLEDIGLDLDRDFWKTNAVLCRPSTSSDANRKPTKVEIKHCRPLLEKTIRDLKPNMIWLLGGTAIESMYGNRFKNLTINRWRKLCIPDRKTGAWVIPLFHPSYVLRNEYDNNLKAVFQRDLKWAKSCISKEPFHFEDERNNIIVLTDFNKIIANLKWLLKQAEKNQLIIYIDYETNALKPQWPGAKIATISYTYNYKSYAFPYQYSDFFTKQQQMHIKALWRKVLQHNQIACVAHNMKFEDNWTRKIFGVQPYSWIHDTMICAHIEDNRSSYCGLKFQSYIKFGLEPYNKEIEKYLKARNGHFNRVDRAPLKELLLYNGLDTYMTMLLHKEQEKIFRLTDKLNPKNNLAGAYNLFHQGILALSDVQMRGVRIDEEYYKEKKRELKDEIEDLRNNKLGKSKEAILFEKKTGKKLDVGSNKDLGILLYDILEQPVKLTSKENYRVDLDALENINLKFVKDLLRLRKLEKASGTYIAQFEREVCNKTIHPFYDLHIPRSFRGSSSLPNWQNIPIRDPEVGKIIRSGILPTKGCMLVELDYSSIEVRMAAVITGDPNLKKYVLDSSTDMHRDSAQDIWMLTKDEVSKDIRKNSKGDWVFAMFYGSFYKQCAQRLWKNRHYKTTTGLTLEQHVKRKGIKSYEEFEEHCKTAEDIFWGERFSKYAEWKREINKKFINKGYIENPYGFRFTGNLDRKQVSNFSIQSAAFHTLLHSLILINNISKEEKWISKIIGQIHDSIILTVHPKEMEHVIKTCRYIMSEKMRELHPWIDVPIPSDVEITNIDEAWYFKKEIKI